MFGGRKTMRNRLNSPLPSFFAPAPEALLSAPRPGPHPLEVYDITYLHFHDNLELGVCVSGQGACQAVNLHLRRPEVCSGVIGLSGRYETANVYGHGPEDLIYRNSPLAYLPHLTEKALERLRRQEPMMLCAGRGPGDEQALEETRRMGEALEAKKLPVWVDEWGTDVTPDWAWWQRQWSYFLEKALEAKPKDQSAK